MIPLIQANPMLVERLSHWPVCRLPTPVMRMEAFGQSVGHKDIFVKRDDLSGILFGGNKVRTLEFLLAAAHRDGGNVVIGLAGSSMALAANIYARFFTLPLKTLLVRQRPTRESRENLRYFAYLEADLEEIDSPGEIDGVMSRINSESLAEFQHPTHRLDPNSTLGMCGYVNAGYELAAQVQAGDLPPPDLIFLAAGLLGTTAGLLVGLRAAGLKAKIVAVSHDWIRPEIAAADRVRITGLAKAVCDYLRVLAPDFPVIPLEPEDVTQVGPDPGRPDGLLEAGMESAGLLADRENVHIEPTWTAQVIGEIRRRAEAGLLDGKMVLDWHTPNSLQYPAEAAEISYKRLPPAFWPHFETGALARINKPASG